MPNSQIRQLEYQEEVIGSTNSILPSPPTLKHPSTPDRPGWGQPRKMQPNAQDCFTLPEMGLKIQARGQRLTFTDAVTGEILFDMSQLLMALKEERHSRRAAEQRAKSAEAENARLKALLAKKEEN